MGRPKQFDSDVVVGRALSVFQARGYAGATTNDLLKAMQIGRQSLYDTFGDKRCLYLLALARYHRERVTVHIGRLRDGTPLGGIEAMLVGLVTDNREGPEIGYLAVGSIAEFGADAQVTKCRAESDALLHMHIVVRLQDAKRIGDMWQRVDCETAACFVETTMLGLQMAARAGVGAAGLNGMVKLAVRALTR